MQRQEFYQVVRNAHADLGLWSIDSAVPPGWGSVGFYGPWDRCLAYVEDPEVQGAHRTRGLLRAIPPTDVWSAAAARSPDHVAIEHGTAQWTYRELDDRSSALAKRLAGQGLRTGDRVALPPDPGAAVVAFLGAAKAQLVVVGMPGEAPVPPSDGYAPWILDDDLRLLPTGAGAGPVPPAGSVMIQYGPSGAGVVLDVTAVTAGPDISLSLRDRIAIGPQAAPHTMALSLMLSGVLLELRAESSPVAWPYKAAEAGAEWWCTQVQVHRRADRLPQVITLAGLAEAGAVGVLGTSADAADGGGQIRALPGRSLYVLDTELRQVPEGEAGRLWIGGNGLARGYLAQSALTYSRLLPDPYGAHGGRMFDTGLRVSRNAAGTIAPV